MERSPNVMAGVNKILRSLVDSEGYLLQNLVFSWLEKIITIVLNDLPTVNRKYSVTIDDQLYQVNL